MAYFWNYIVDVKQPGCPCGSVLLFIFAKMKTNIKVHWGIQTTNALHKKQTFYVRVLCVFVHYWNDKALFKCNNNTFLEWQFVSMRIKTLLKWPPPLRGITNISLVFIIHFVLKLDTTFFCLGSVISSIFQFSFGTKKL